MKFTSMIKAAALVGVVAMGTQASATDYSFDFSGWDFGSVYGKGYQGVTVDAEDSSAVVTGTLSPKMLELNTDGQDLEFATPTADGNNVTVTALMKMVGSDSCGLGADADEAQTALYLNVVDDIVTGTLMAWSYNATPNVEANEWIELTQAGTTAPFAIEDGSWVSVQTVINYEAGEVTYTINGVAATPINLGNALSHEATGTKCISTVAFRGTGAVDNFAVSEAVATAYATFYKQVNGGEPVLEGTVASVNGAIQITAIAKEDIAGGYQASTTATVYAYENGEQGDEVANLVVTPDEGYVNFDIVASADTYTEGGTYILVYNDTPMDITYTFSFYAGPDSEEVIGTTVVTGSYGPSLYVDVEQYGYVPGDLFGYSSDSGDEGFENPFFIEYEWDDDVGANVGISVWGVTAAEPPPADEGDIDIGPFSLSFGEDGLRFTSIALADGKVTVTFPATVIGTFEDNYAINVLTSTTLDGEPVENRGLLVQVGDGEFSVTFSVESDAIFVKGLAPSLL